MDRPSLTEPEDISPPYDTAAPMDPSPPMLDFRGHDGTTFALPYRLLRSIAFHVADSMVLDFGEHRVTVRGRNLRPVHEALLEHRVRYLREERFDDAPESAPFIDAITVEDVNAPS